MRVLELGALDGPDGFALAERPEPAARDDRVLIDVGAAGVGFPDLLMSRGAYQVHPALPFVAGMDVAGTVRSAPAGASVARGQRVWAALDHGGFAEVVAVPPERVFALPSELSLQQGAALGSNFLTAICALQRRGGVSACESVLVLGAAGGLGSACVSVARAIGARVLAVVSRAEKTATARLAGADEIIIGEDFRDAVLARTDGRGVDAVVDVVGGERTLEAIRSTAPEGRVLVLGFTAGSIPSIATNRLLLRNVSLIGVGLGALSASAPDVIEQGAVELCHLIARGLRPIVGATFPLADGAQAVRALENRSARGKIVLTFHQTPAG